MRAEEIRKHLKRATFQPFRLHISGGSHYDVRHPGFIQVTRTHVLIGPYPDSQDISETSFLCDPLHVTRIELAPGKKSTSRAKRQA